MEFECRERFAKAPFICTRGEQTSKTIASIRSNLKGSYLKNDFFDFFSFSWSFVPIWCTDSSKLRGLSSKYKFN